MYDWKILGVTADETGLITEARYFASVELDGDKVETEGNWYFNEPKLTIPFEQVTEENVIAWIQKEATKDGDNSVECRLNEQLEALASQRDTVAPWMPQVFTPKI